MDKREWEFFDYAIRLYRAGKIDRERFCVMWNCAQQLNEYNKWFNAVEGMYDFEED